METIKTVSISELHLSLIHILLGQENSVSYLRELDSNYIRLESMMMEMFGNGITEFSLHRYHYGMEILATKKDVLKITEDLSRDGLFAELKKRKTGWNFCIGYGFGAGIAQARLNALNACHEAELKKNTSCLLYTSRCV